MARVRAPASNSFFTTLFRSRCIVWGINSSNCSPLSVRGSVAQWRRTQCANCSEPRFDSRERQKKRNFLCHILKVMPQYPYGEPGVSVAWSHLGMRTGNSANEGDRLGSCWARGRIRYGMGVAAENLTFCRTFLFFLLFLPCF